jgi:hypothetical protein
LHVEKKRLKRKGRLFGTAALQPKRKAYILYTVSTYSVPRWPGGVVWKSPAGRRGLIRVTSYGGRVRVIKFSHVPVCPAALSLFRNRKH